MESHEAGAHKIGLTGRRDGHLFVRAKMNQKIHRTEMRINGIKKYEYAVIAERALGKSFPARAEVHHANGDPTDNSPDNLVICPSRAYHLLLHERMRALAACGHADWRSCDQCKQFDAPENLTILTRRVYHKDCEATQARERYRSQQNSATRTPGSRSARNGVTAGRDRQRTPVRSVRKPLRRAGKARDALAILLRLGRDRVKGPNELAEAAARSGVWDQPIQTSKPT